MLSVTEQFVLEKEPANPWSHDKYRMLFALPSSLRIVETMTTGTRRQLETRNLFETVRAFIFVPTLSPPATKQDQEFIQDWP